MNLRWVSIGIEPTVNSSDSVSLSLGSGLASVRQKWLRSVEFVLTINKIQVRFRLGSIPISSSHSLNVYVCAYKMIFAVLDGRFM